MNVKHNEHLLKSSTYLSVIISFLIVIAKIYGTFSTSSVALMATLADSIFDITASIINFIAIRVALLPPDDNHRFGHEKVQDLAIFAQTIFFFASALFIAFTAVNRLFNYQPIHDTDIGIKVLIFSSICTLILVSYQTYVLSKVKSNIIVADKLHYVTDLFANIAVIISIYFSSEEYYYLDSIAGLLISVYLCYGAVSIFKVAIKNLIDEECSSSEKILILKTLKEFKSRGQISAVHDLKTRKAGDKYFIQFHLELDGNMSLYNAHEISEAVSDEIRLKFPTSEIIIHQDPAGVETEIDFLQELNV